MLVDRPGLGAWVASLGIVVAYVGSLYVWPARHRAPRDAPGVIKRRFLSLAGACALACLPLHRALLAAEVSPRPPSLARALGVHPDPVAAVASVASTLGLAAALFLGPLVALALDGRLLSRFADALRLDRLVKWRNYVVAPATEEFAFRACVAPLLLVTGAATLRGAVFSPPRFSSASRTSTTSPNSDDAREAPPPRLSASPRSSHTPSSSDGSPRSRFSARGTSPAPSPRTRSATSWGYRTCRAPRRTRKRRS